MLDEQSRRAELVTRINAAVTRDGLAGQSMASLAKAIGVSRGKLYVYFSSRDEVVAALVDRYVALTERQMRTPAATWSKQALPQWLLAEVLVLASGSPSFLSDLAHAYPAERQRVEAALQQWEERLAAYLNEGVANGTFHAVDISLLLAMMRATVVGLTGQAQLTAAGVKPALKHLIRILTLVLLDEAAAKPLLTQERTQRAVTALAGELTALYLH